MQKTDLKIGFLEYFATGEGLTYFIFCNTDNDIPNEMPDYFQQGIEYIRAEEIMNYLNIFEDEMECSQDQQRKFKIIERKCPIIIDFLKEDAMYDFSFYQTHHVRKDTF